MKSKFKGCIGPHLAANAFLCDLPKALASWAPHLLCGSRVDISSAALVTNAPDDKEWSDDDLPSPDFPIEQFMSELEERMIAGQSRYALRQWAFVEHGVKKESLQKFAELVRATWAYADQTYSESRRARQNVRDKLEKLYVLTTEAKQYHTALQVVQTMAELDGLKSPDLHFTQVNNVVGGPGTPQITNRTRERLAELHETMRLRADQRALRREEDHERLLAAKSGNPGPKNGNGHG